MLRLYRDKTNQLKTDIRWKTNTTRYTKCMYQILLGNKKLQGNKKIK